jgi:hypothetical protein
MFEDDNDAAKAIALRETMGLSKSSLDFSFIAFVGSHFGSVPGMGIPANGGAHRCFPMPIEDRDDDFVPCSRAWVIKNGINRTVFHATKVEKDLSSIPSPGPLAPLEMVRSV